MSRAVSRHQLLPAAASAAREGYTSHAFALVRHAVLAYSHLHYADFARFAGWRCVITLYKIRCYVSLEHAF